jgi:hypothetical protein
MLLMLKSSIKEEGNRRRRDDQNSEAMSECLKLCCIFIIEQLLNLVETLMNIFNKYAFCYVAAYGYSFVDSGRRVFSLFENRGWKAIINDSLISNVLFLSTLLLAAINFLVGIVVAMIWQDTLLAGMPSPEIVCGMLGALSGGVVGFILITTIESGVSMVFICYAEGERELLVCLLYIRSTV